MVVTLLKKGVCSNCRGKKKRKTLSHFSANQGKSMPECVLIQVLYEQSFILSAVSQTHLRRVVDVLFIVFNGQNI